MRRDVVLRHGGVMVVVFSRETARVIFEERERERGRETERELQSRKKREEKEWWYGDSTVVVVEERRSRSSGGGKVKTEGGRESRI